MGRPTSLADLRPGALTRRQRLLVVYAIGIVATVLTFSLLYAWGMARLEGRPRSFLHSLNIVIETMTTTGFGADAPWDTPGMILLVVTMQVTGVVLGFVTLRVLVIPLFERAPLHLDDRLTVKDDHVVVAEYERDSEVLLAEFETLDVDYVLVESDVEEAKRLSDEGYQVLDGDPEDGDDLERASIGRASLLITDAGDRTASVVLTALEHNEDLRVVAFTESIRRRAALAEVGVDRSVSPHVLIGQQLAEKATTPVSLDSSTGSEDVVIREVLVRRNGPLHGVRLADAPFASHPNLTVVAGWFDGTLRLPPSPDDRLTPNTVLVLAGPSAAIDEVASDLARVRTLPGSPHGRIVVAGYGEGGVAAADALPADAQVTTVDADPGRDPDVVGDVTEPETLSAAGIEDATALVVTVDDDATALLTIAMARSLADDLEILARVTDAEKEPAAFRAGADYVLSVQRAAARLVAAEVHGERVLTPVGQIRVARVDGASFADEQLADLRDDPERGWTVVGVVRDGSLMTDSSIVVGADEDVFVAGSDEAIQLLDREIEE